ncbi:MAG: porin family protein [Alphaproteobacteria bacterium]|nr:porin family protein [Alphaproteobacteria bacterium]
MRWFVVLGLLCAAFSSSATAADLGGDYRGSYKDSFKDDVPYVAPFTWTGAYVGLQGGYAWGDADHSFIGGAGGGAPSDNSDPEGFIGGGHVGYNVQSGNVVFGVEADIEGGEFDGGYTNLNGITSVGDVDLNWQGSLRARLGWASGTSLFYITGGWAFADFDFSGGPAPGPACCGYSETLNGWTLGAGAEWAFTNNMTMRLEYRYTDFEEASGNLSPIFANTRMPVDLDVHAVRAGISYKF